MIPSKTTVGSNHRRIVLALLLAVLLCGLVFVSPATGPQAQAQAFTAPEVQADVDWGRMPLYFIANDGQLDDAVAYYVQGADKTLYFTGEGLTFALSGPAEEAEADTQDALRPEAPMPAPQERWTVRLDYLGASAATPEGKEKTEAVISYFQGSEEDWVAGIPTYSAVAYEGLWEGIDLFYSGTQDQLKQEFVLAPGADPDQIRLSYQGASLTLSDQGELEVSTPVGGFNDEAPVAYQEVNGRRVEVEVSYALDASSGSGALETTTYGFALGDYDPSLPLVIDPAVLVYCGYVGGSSINKSRYEQANGIAVDSSGCAYVTGFTWSNQSTFPVTVGPDLTRNGDYDAFVAKVSADGTSLVYCGYIGGDDYDQANDIAVDASGNAYVAGYTISTEATFPVAGGPDLTQNSPYPGYYEDAFVAKVSADGTFLVYCGYIGGVYDDQANGIAVDSSGCAYITGWTSSAGYAPQYSFPEVVGPDLYGSTNREVAFVAKVSTDGGSLVYSGYLGFNDHGEDIAVDASGCAYVTGYVHSTGSFPYYGNSIPVTVGPDLTFNGGYYDAFVLKVLADGSGLAYCGYIGGPMDYYLASSYPGDDYGYGIAVDSSGCAYVTGTTRSTEFAVNGGPDIVHNGGGRDAFVTKVWASGAGLVYSGYIGGAGWDEGRDIAVDSSGRAYVTGYTSSSAGAYYGTSYSFPVVNARDTTFNGSYDAFVARVLVDGTGLDYCGYIGGGDDDRGYGIAVDDDDNAYVAGYACSNEASASFPVSVGPDLTKNGGRYDAFVAKVSVIPEPTVTDVSPNIGPTTGGTTVTITGTNLTTTRSVMFGGVEATSFTVDSDTQITAETPAHGARTVRTKVTTAAGPSANTAADDFHYVYLERYEQDEPNIVYDGSWDTITHASASGGNCEKTTTAGATITVEFAGDYIAWIARTSPNTGIAQVTLDSGTSEDVDLYAESVAWQQTVWEAVGLGGGTHTLVIECTGTKNASSGGTDVNIDAIDTSGSLGPARDTTELLRYRAPSRLGESLRELVDAYETGELFTIDSAIWPGGWTHVVPVEMDEDARSEILAYNKNNGRVVFLELSALGRAKKISEDVWDKGWKHIVPVEVDGDPQSELVLYGGSGLLKVVDLDGAGNISVLSKSKWPSRLTHLVPLEIDGDARSEVLLYKKKTGLRIFLDLSTLGEATKVSSGRWTRYLTAIVPVEVDGDAQSELLLYRSGSKLRKVVDLDMTGHTTLLSKGSWTSGLTHVVPVEIDGDARSEVLLYKKKTGLAIFVDLHSVGKVSNISVSSWGRGWKHIVPVEVDGS